MGVAESQRRARSVARTQHVPSPVEHLSSAVAVFDDHRAIGPRAWVLVSTVLTADGRVPAILPRVVEGGPAPRIRTKVRMIFRPHLCSILLAR